jgi:hypothetical protein
MGDYHNNTVRLGNIAYVSGGLGIDWLNLQLAISSNTASSTLSFFVLKPGWRL